MSICTSLDLYFEMGPPMSENQVKESQSRVASHHPTRRGTGRYMHPLREWNRTFISLHFLIPFHFSLFSLLLLLHL